MKTGNEIILSPYIGYNVYSKIKQLNNLKKGFCSSVKDDLMFQSEAFEDIINLECQLIASGELDSKLMTI